MDFRLDMLPRFRELTAVYCAADSPEWHAERRRRVGCSEAACLLGLWTWDGAPSPADLAAEKREGTVKEPNWAMLQGSVMEDLIASTWAKSQGCELVRVPTLFLTDRPWHGGNFDRLAVYPDGRVVLVECKWHRRKPKELPPYHYAQLQRELALTGLTDGALVCAGPWDEPYHYDIEADAGTQASIEAAVEAFSIEHGMTGGAQ